MIQTQNEIMALVNAGQIQEARHVCQIACEQDSQNAQLWFMLSAICGQMQDFPAAEKYCQMSLELNGATTTLYYNLAVTQRGQGKTKEALNSLHEAIKLQNDFTAALYETGNIYLQQNDNEKAIENYQKLLTTSPATFQAYTGIAIAHQQSGNLDAAIVSFLKSLEINSEQQDVTLRLAMLYDAQNDFLPAIKYYENAILQGYDKEDVYINLGRMFASLGNTDSAKEIYQKAISINQKSVEALSNMALLYEQVHETAKAQEYIKNAVDLNPVDLRIHFNYAKILASSCQYVEAEKQYQIILKKDPGFIDAAVNLGNLLLLSGRADEAQDIYAKACQQRQDNHVVCSNMLMSLNYTNRYTESEIFDKHIKWAQRLEKDTTHISQGMKNINQPLRVGYVSPDFKDHSVAYFVEGILRHSDENKIDNYCYSDVKNTDEVTDRLKSYCKNWHDVSTMSDKIMAEQIQKDNIDILIDLCGHMSGNRLPMFAMKPAPLQVTYLGYPNTTGLTAMDYRLVDRYTDPEGSEALMTETPLYLAPCFLSYTPYVKSPDVSELPAIKNKHITFGSFNNLAKLSDEVIECWAEILKKVADSRLCIKARQFSDPAIKADYTEHFKQAGINESRLELIGYSLSTTEHLELYNKIDIALDTFPYNGTTTTFEALWMGVPVICLHGSKHANRVGESIIKTLGSDDLLAESPQRYIELASDLSKDTRKLQSIRENLRNRMHSSPLLDTVTFVKKYETLLTTITKQHKL